MSRNEIENILEFQLSSVLNLIRVFNGKENQGIVPFISLLFLLFIEGDYTNEIIRNSIKPLQRKQSLDFANNIDFSSHPDNNLRNANERME